MTAKSRKEEIHHWDWSLLIESITTQVAALDRSRRTRGQGGGGGWGGEEGRGGGGGGWGREEGRGGGCCRSLVCALLGWCLHLCWHTDWFLRVIHTVAVTLESWGKNLRLATLSSLTQWCLWQRVYTIHLSPYHVVVMHNLWDVTRLHPITSTNSHQHRCSPNDFSISLHITQRLASVDAFLCDGK